MGRGGSRGPAQVGACLLPSSFSTRTSGAFPQRGSGMLSPGQKVQVMALMASNWFFETGRSSGVLAALPTGDALLEGVQVENSLGLRGLRLCLICSWCPGA